LFYFRNVTKLYGLHNHPLFGFWNVTKLYVLRNNVLSTLNMSRNFMDCLTMGVKYLEVIKRGSHPNKQMVPGRNLGMTPGKPKVSLGELGSRKTKEKTLLPPFYLVFFTFLIKTLNDHLFRIVTSIQHCKSTSKDQKINKR